MEGYFKDLIKVLGVGAAFASIPLFLSLAELQPPWPPAIGQVSAAMVLVAALIAWEWGRAAPIKARRKLIGGALLLSLAGLALYLPVYSMFVESIPGENVRVTRGYTCTTDAMEVYGTSCPELSRDALRDAEWQPDVLWTRQSVAAVRVGLAFSWLLFCAGLVLAVGSVVAGRKFSRKANDRERKLKTDGP